MHVFSNGKTERLVHYWPERFEIDRDIVVFTDLDNRLVGYIDGKFQKISIGPVSKFKVVNKAVLYYLVQNHLKVFCNGKVESLY